MEKFKTEEPDISEDFNMNLLLPEPDIDEFEPGDNYEIENSTVETIKEKIKELQGLCNYNKVPIFIAAATKNTVMGTEYTKMAVTPQDVGVKLRNDRISPLLLVVNGFRVTNNIPAEFEIL